jgi:erythromycin esterase
MPWNSPLHRAFVASGLLILTGCHGARTDNHSSRPVNETEIVSSLVSLSDTQRTVAVLRALVGGRRFVLLGENGHGVGPHTTLKVDLTRLLLDSLGFSTVVFESGYHECSEADEALARASAVSSLRDCLAFAFEHAEALPLFEHLRTARAGGRALHIAGADLQPQGPASLSRPNLLRQALAPHDPALAEATALADSGLLLASQRGGDSLRLWLRQHASAAGRAFKRSLRVVDPSLRWHLHASLGLLRRGELRFASGALDGVVPAAYYAERDKFMAQSISWIADSGGPPKRVVVWMHNDHVRRGLLSSPGGSIPATGGLLAAQYPRDVISLGFFMGAGEVTNNSRAVRTVLPLEEGSIEEVLDRSGRHASILVLRNARSAAVRRWAEVPQRYLRNGLAADTLVPAAEFDALVFTTRASPPTYRLPNR